MPLPRSLYFVTGLAAGLYASYKLDFNRLGRMLYPLKESTKIAYQYLYVYPRKSQKANMTKEEYKRLKSLAHENSAKILLNLCRKLGGFYTKMGQFISTNHFVYPPEYINTLRELTDKGQEFSYHDICDLFEHDLGKQPEEIFKEFDPKPVASASLAQVHRAKTKSGEDVAVKVQYPNLNYELHTDLISFKLILTIYQFLFPKFNFLKPAEVYMNIFLRETNFLNEIENTNRLNSYIKGNDDIYLPKMIPELSTSRILTMEYIEGYKLYDLENINKFNFQNKDIIHTISQYFAKMIFYYGFVHMDPHPGNLFVRPKPLDKSKFQIVLIDHGMYGDISPKMRHLLSQYWIAILFFDHKEITRLCEEMGFSQYKEFMNLMIALQSSESHIVDPSSTPQEKRRQVKKYIKKLFDSYEKPFYAIALEFSTSVPPELMLVLRPFNILRSYDKLYHTSHVERLKIMARIANNELYGGVDKINDLPFPSLITYYFNVMWFHLEFLYYQKMMMR